MKVILRNIVVAAFITLGTFATVVYTSCTRDHCNNVACLNGGSCDGGNCTCPAGYEGLRCETYSRDKYVGNYNGSDSCTIYGDNQYPLHFFAVTTNPVEMTLKNILNNANDSALCTMRSVDSFTFTGNNNSTTYSGTGVISNDSLRMTYHVQHDTINYDCKFAGIRY